MDEKLTILVVDDVEVNRASLREIFRKEYNILEAEDGLEAMRRLREKRIDIVLLDLFMPNLDGAGVLRQMKTDRLLDGIPVVVKTAVDESVEIDMLELGADDFIFSPCDPALIKKRVKNIAEKYICERAMLQRQIEIEKKLVRMKSELLTGFFQEIRTPLQKILSVSVEQQTGDAKEVKKAFREIREQGEQIASLAEKASDMQNTDEKRLLESRKTFSLKDVLRTITAEAYEKCKKNGIELQFQISDLTYENLIGNPGHLADIWKHLLENACREASFGDVLKTGFRERKISPDIVELEIFVQDKGNGRGLTLINSAAGIAGGTAAVKRMGNGQPVIQVKLPFGLENKPELECKKFHSMKAVILDDNEIMRNYLALTFARLGIHCEIAGNRREAIRLLSDAKMRGNGYDICFVNWYMENGEAAVREIRGLYRPETLKIFSAVDDLGKMEGAINAAGVDYVLAKPVFQSKLYDLMTNVCR